MRRSSPSVKYEKTAPAENTAAITPVTRQDDVRVAPGAAAVEPVIAASPASTTFKLPALPPIPTPATSGVANEQGAMTPVKLPTAAHEPAATTSSVHVTTRIADSTAVSNPAIGGDQLHATESTAAVVGTSASHAEQATIASPQHITSPNPTATVVTPAAPVTVATSAELAAAAAAFTALVLPKQGDLLSQALVKPVVHDESADATADAEKRHGDDQAS